MLVQREIKMWNVDTIWIQNKTKQNPSFVLGYNLLITVTLTVKNLFESLIEGKPSVQEWEMQESVNIKRKKSHLNFQCN